MIRPKMEKPSKADAHRAVSAVKKRSGGVCEGCGQAKATDVHHRLYRSRGGLDAAENLLHLCGGPSGLPGGNHSGCHGVAHTAEGEARGWSVRSGHDPSEVPVWTPAGWVRLSDTAALERVHSADAVEYMVLIGAIVQVA